MKGVGYWISPSPANKAYRLSTTHIGMIQSNPELFGTTEKDLRDLFKKHGEKWGSASEGAAREEALLAAVKKEWIRIRHYPNKQISFNTGRMTSQTAGVIEAFLRNAIKQREIQDLYLPVVVGVLNKQAIRSTVYKIINKFALTEEGEELSSTQKRVIAESNAAALEFLDETRLTPDIVEQHMRLIASKVPLAELHPNVSRTIQEQGWADGKTD